MSIFEWLRDTYENSPEVDDNKKCEIKLPMKWENENEEVVRHRLKVAVKRVESM